MPGFFENGGIVGGVVGGGIEHLPAGIEIAIGGQWIEGAACGFDGGFLKFCGGDICYIAFEGAEGKERAPSEPEELDAVCFVDCVALLFAGCVFGFIYVFEAVGEPWNGVFGFEGRETGEEFGRFYEVEDEAADGIEFCLFELILIGAHKPKF